MGEHLVLGEFKSDKYDWCKRGFVPLKLTDPNARLVLRIYAELRRSIDSEFSDDLIEAIRLKDQKQGTALSVLHPGVELIICDGCNVREPHEHRCHRFPITRFGVKMSKACECLACREADRAMIPRQGNFNSAIDQRQREGKDTLG